MTGKHLFPVVGCALLMAFSSCLNDDDSLDSQRPTALVTVCPNTDGSFVMQLDNDTQLIPTNLKASPFGTKEVRALVNYTESCASSRDKNIRNVEINWLDSIRTKMPAQSLGDRNDEMYGDDPVEIVNDWITVAEDGYLTLRIRTLWGQTQVPHVLNIITGTNPDDPYDLELRHDANGDKYGNWGDALIAFNLNKLPREDSDIKSVKLKWKSFTGDKSARFEIKLRPQGQDGQE